MRLRRRGDRLAVAPCPKPRDSCARPKFIDLISANLPVRGNCHCSPEAARYAACQHDGAATLGDQTHPHTRFDAPAMLRKWPSRNNERRRDGSTYLVAEGTLGMS